MIKPIIILYIFSFLNFGSPVKHSVIHSQPPYKHPSKLIELYDYTKKSSLESFNTEDSDLILVESNQSGLFYVNDQNGFIVEYPFLKNNDFDRLILNRIENYNSISESIPEIPIYIYQVANARDTSWFDSMNYLQGAAPEYNQLLSSLLNSSIQFQSSNYRNWTLYTFQNYITDHHWNVFGAYHGYTDIISMLQKDFPQIGNKKEPIRITCSGTPFTGSMYINDAKQTDTLCDFIYNLPEPAITLNGNPIQEYGNRSLLTSDYSETTQFTNLYKAVFGADSAEVIYKYTNNTGINALIISDSYSNAIKPVLSSHFDKTIFIDLRHYLNEFGDYFNLSDYLSKYDIDFILYLGGFFTTIMDESYLINIY